MPDRREATRRPAAVPVAQVANPLGSGFGLPAAGAGGLGIVGLLLYLVVGTLGGGTAAPSLRGAPDADTDLRDFVGFLSEHVQETWVQQSQGRQYEATGVVLFNGATPMGCGVGSSRTGPR